MTRICHHENSIVTHEKVVGWKVTKRGFYQINFTIDNVKRKKKIGVGSPLIFWLTCDGTTGILISLI